MKLKFVLVLLVVIGGCSSPQKSINIYKIEWITPSSSVCKSNGGKVDSRGCKATWENAKNICSASGGSLPNKDTLIRVISECHGTVNDYENNERNSFYQDCYKKKGFNNSLNYWSYIYPGFLRRVKYTFRIYFYFGSINLSSKGNLNYIRCVRD